MSSSQLPPIGLALAAVVVFGSGFWLSRAGRPYGPASLNVHKLVDLAAVIVLGVMVCRASRVSLLSAGEWLTVTLTGALFVALFATGAVSSAAEAPPKWVVRLHHLAPWAAVVLAALTAYLAAGA